MSLLRPARCVDGQFQNPVPTEITPRKNIVPMLRKAFTSKAERVPKQQLGPFRTDTAVYSTAPASGLRITLLGHSSLLVEIDGTTLLIDPVFSQRASMVQWAGPKRFFSAPLRIEDLPPLDVVLLTHDHYDHLDKAALPHLQERTPLFICSQGVERHLQRWGVTGSRVQPMNWMDRFTVPSRRAEASATPLEMTALPARHFSGRSLRRNRTLWSSFALKTARHNVYHGADSGYYEGFREIGNAFGPFDLAMLEIGAFDELWAPIHLGPDHALKAAIDLGARAVMPIHWGLFNLAFHAWYQPPERFTAIAAEAGLPVFLPEPGSPTEFTGAAANSLWWQRYCKPAGERDTSGAGSAAAAVVARS